MPTLGSIAKTDIVQICVHFIEETMNLNVDTLNEGTRYHIFPQLNLEGENWRILSRDIKGVKYHDVQMIQIRVEQNLMDVLAFHKQFPLAVCKVLRSKFYGNDIMIVLNYWVQLICLHDN